MVITVFLEAIERMGGVSWEFFRNAEQVGYTLEAIIIKGTPPYMDATYP